MVAQVTPPGQAAPVAAEACQTPAAPVAAAAHPAPAAPVAAKACPAPATPGTSGKPLSQQKKGGWKVAGEKRPNKRRKLKQPTFEESKNWVPDVLLDEPGRVHAIQTMINEAQRLKYAVCPRLFGVLKATYPGKGDDYYRRWSNGIFCSLQAHIMTSCCRPSVAVPMVLPPGLEDLLLPEEDYTQAQYFMQSFDLREAEKMKVLRVLVWLQHCEQQTRYGRQARYFVDPVSQTEIRLTQMFVDSGALQIIIIIISLFTLSSCFTKCHVQRKNTIFLFFT